MINLEGISRRIASALFKSHQQDEMERAGVEYGLTIMLGVLIELALALVLSMVLKTVFYTVAIMVSSLIRRVFTGGCHCSGYGRCLVFTIIYFMPTSLLAKFLHLSWKPEAVFILCGLIMVFVLAVVAIKRNTYGLCISILAAAMILMGTVPAIRTTLSRFVLSISLGLLLQALMLTRFGKRMVEKADGMMRAFNI